MRLNRPKDLPVFEFPSSASCLLSPLLFNVSLLSSALNKFSKITIIFGHLINILKRKYLQRGMSFSWTFQRDSSRLANRRRHCTDWVKSVHCAVFERKKRELFRNSCSNSFYPPLRGTFATNNFIRDFAFHSLVHDRARQSEKLNTERERERERERRLVAL